MLQENIEEASNHACQRGFKIIRTGSKLLGLCKLGALHSAINLYSVSLVSSHPEVLCKKLVKQFTYRKHLQRITAKDLSKFVTVNCTNVIYLPT